MGEIGVGAIEVLGVMGMCLSSLVVNQHLRRYAIGVALCLVVAAP